ncbi:hypothetical protein [Iodidimonas sp. SYSU 1G8]|uniref:hypothetical protein n=1 Tax=Iodidimonas sp. SYSU 1G8 TaxID=3133967 RepID=UPI0031FE5202
MTSTYLNSQIGLTLLSGGAVTLSSTSAPAVESLAVRKAKAAFTTPATTPPWKETAATQPVSSQVAAIKQRASLIDKVDTSLPADIQTAFVTYKALDRLRLLADTAASSTRSAGERAALSKTFSKGLADLRTFLAAAPTDALLLSFNMPERSAKSLAVDLPPASMTTLGDGVSEQRDAPLAGLSGTEVLRVALTRGSTADSIDIDLSSAPQPPTLDTVANALNAAIASIPQRDSSGAVVTDAGGAPLSRYTARFAVEKHDGKWGLALQAPPSERVALDQVAAPDTLVVAAGETQTGASGTVRLLRYDDPAGAFTRTMLGTLSATNRPATEAVQLKDSKATPVSAALDARAIVTAPDGFSYMVGTSSGDLGANRVDTASDLFLTKLDSEGRTVWQRTLGMAGAAQGASVALAPDGGIVVAGNISATGVAQTDIVVARYDEDGEERFATSLHLLGNQEARAVTVGQDGSIFVGGRSGDLESDAFLARLDGSGAVKEKRLFGGAGPDTVSALAIDGDGALLVLARGNGTSTLRRLDAGALTTESALVDLGTVDARVMAIAPDGTVAIGGAVAQGASGGRDGFIARIDGAFSLASLQHVGTGGTDEIDSLAFIGDALYAAGRTTGALSGEPQGTVDGFIGKVDPATGALADVTQFGQRGVTAAPVRLSAGIGGGGVTGALGLHRGVLNPVPAADLVSLTSLRAGDEFKIRVGGVTRKITIEADDTLASLAKCISLVTWNRVKASTWRSGDTLALKIDAVRGYPVELIAGADGKDALGKLGLAPTRLANPAPRASGAPKVEPGGRFGLGLSTSLSLDTADAAKGALKSVLAALSTSQTAYRSLYWDATKANLVDGVTGYSLTSRQQTQLDQYQAALTRLSALTAS